MSSTPEKRNPLYLLLLLASLLFVLTALAYALIPTLEEKAIEAGSPPPASPLRDALRRDGWKWLLYQVAVVIILGLASMWEDSRRLRRLQKQRPEVTIAPTKPEEKPPTPPKVPHEQPGQEDRGAAQAD
jgi:hypothetical protein